MDKKVKKYTSFFIQSIEIVFFQFISIFYQHQKKYKNLWLFCERGYDAQDNAFLFFQYVKEKYPDQNVAFLLKKNQNLNEDFNPQEIIAFGSRTHKLAFTLCKKSISTHVGFVEPWNLKLYKLLTLSKSQYVFLQHGITYNDVSKYLKKSISPIDLFTIASDFEKNQIESPRYGYTEEEIKLTGFARFDRLFQNQNKVCNQILYMPTWVRGIDSESDFMVSEFYQRTQSLLNNETLLNQLEAHDLILKFVLHPEFKQYQSLYSIPSKNVEIINPANSNIQDLLIASKLLITDYSSVFFDMAFLNRPILFYQFAKFKNYKATSFDFNKFGKKTSVEVDLIQFFLESLQNNFEPEFIYSQNTLSFFKYRDERNCERIYNEMILMK